MDLAKNDLLKNKFFLLVIVIFIFGLIIFFKQNSKSSFTNFSSENSKPFIAKDIAGLQKIDTKEYVFYYPKEYIKSEKFVNNDTILSYVLEDKDENLNWIRLRIYPLDMENEDFSSLDCNTIVANSIGDDKNLKAQDIKIINSGKILGCEFWVVYNGIGEEMIFHDKILWDKNSTDKNQYWVSGNYLKIDPKQRKDAIDMAVENFIIR